MAGYKYSEWTDDRLLDQIRYRDDRAAFAELYDRYWRPLINMAGKRNLPMEVAEEIVQDVFVDFYVRRKEIRIESSVAAYLKTATKYQVYKAYRAQQVHATYVNTIIAADQIHPPAPDTMLESRQLREELYRATEKMSGPCRDVFLLSRFEELPNREIAKKMNMSLAMVRKHITKAMHMMRAEFKDRAADLLTIALFIFSGLFR